VVSWPLAYGGYHLESATSLGSDSAWQRITNNISKTLSSYTFTNQISSGTRFFRLDLK
jgi:hypothetical protein